MSAILNPLLLRKIIMQWIFPPGGIIIAVLLIFSLFLLDRKKIAIFLSVLLIFLLYLFSSWFGEYILLKPLEDDYTYLQETQMDNLNLTNPIIVVLGGGIVEDSLAEGKVSTEVGEVTLARLYGAYRIYKNLECPVWVSGGTVPGFSGNIPAADVMGEVLVELGISREDIYNETQSRTTFENAHFTIEQIKQQGYHEIILVTSAVHMRRSAQVFENSDITIIPAPVNYLFENSRPGILDILPNRFSWDHNLRALHEWIGLLYYRIFYL